VFSFVSIFLLKENLIIPLPSPFFPPVPPTSHPPLSQIYSKYSFMWNLRSWRNREGRLSYWSSTMGQESLLLADRGGEGGVRLEAESRMFWKVHSISSSCLSWMYSGLVWEFPFRLVWCLSNTNWPIARTLKISLVCPTIVCSFSSLWWIQSFSFLCESYTLPLR